MEMVSRQQVSGRKLLVSVDSIVLRLFPQPIVCQDIDSQQVSVHWRRFTQDVATGHLLLATGGCFTTSATVVGCRLKDLEELSRIMLLPLLLCGRDVVDTRDGNGVVVVAFMIVGVGMMVACII